MTDHSEGVIKMKTNSSVLSGKFWLAVLAKGKGEILVLLSLQ